MTSVAVVWTSGFSSSLHCLAFAAHLSALLWSGDCIGMARHEKRRERRRVRGSLVAFLDKLLATCLECKECRWQLKSVRVIGLELGSKCGLRGREESRVYESGLAFFDFDCSVLRVFCLNVCGLRVSSPLCVILHFSNLSAVTLFRRRPWRTLELYTWFRQYLSITL